jgi:hypothetical protein
VMSRIDSAKKLLALAQAAENEDNWVFTHTKI